MTSPITSSHLGRPRSAVDGAHDGRRIDLHARPHRRGDGDALDVVPLGARGLRLGDRIGEGADVLGELVGIEGCLADAPMHDAGLLDAELDRAALRGAHRARDVRRHRADARIGHQAARPEHLAEPPDERHEIRRRDAAVEIDLPRIDLLDEVLRTDDVGASGLGLLGLAGAREDGDAHRAAGAVRQLAHAAHHLIRMARVDAEIHGDLDRLVELRLGALLDELHRLAERVELGAIDALEGGLVTLSCAHLVTPPLRGPWSGPSPRPWPLRIPRCCNSGRAASPARSRGSAPSSPCRPGCDRAPSSRS